MLTPKRLCYFTDSVAAANFEKIGKEMSAKLADVLIHRFVMVCTLSYAVAFSAYCHVPVFPLVLFCQLNEASVDISPVDVSNHPHTFRVVTTESTLTLAGTFSNTKTGFITFMILLLLYLEMLYFLFLCSG